MASIKFSNPRWLIALAVPLLLLGTAWTGSPASKDAYVNSHLGFSMAPPSFTVDPAVAVATVAQFYAPPANGFADNLNVQIHRAPFAAFCKKSDEEFKSGSYTLIASKDLKLGTAAAHEYHYRAKASNFDLEFISVAVASGDDTYLLTATALQSDFAKIEPAFRAAIESFKLDK